MIRDSGVKQIVIPDHNKVLARFLAGRDSIKPRSQRDFPRLLMLIKGLALLNCFHREEVPSAIVDKGDRLLHEIANLILPLLYILARFIYSALRTEKRSTYILV